MSYYKTCPRCGAHLDPGEVCDCLDVESQILLNHENNGLPGAANTEQAEGGKQGLSDTDSTSNDTKETEKCKYELQSYIWHT